MTGPLTIRKGRRDDAPSLVRAVIMAGEGLPLHVWQSMARPGQSVHEVGIARAQRDKGSLSWRNAFIAEIGCVAVGALVGFSQPDEPQPTDDLPPMFRVLQELENLAPGSHYVNVLAVFHPWQGRGIGRLLLRHFEDKVPDGGTLSIIVANRNERALDLYLSEGYAETARRPIVKEGGWECDSDEWILLTRAVQRLGVAEHRKSA
jgi:ribosomal protein S18 acetylase RimI-like enzyme